MYLLFAQKLGTKTIQENFYLHLYVLDICNKFIVDDMWNIYKNNQRYTASCKNMEVGFKLYVCVFAVYVFDPGASGNLLLYSVSEQLGLGELIPTSIILQLANQFVIVLKDIPHAINTLKV